MNLLSNGRMRFFGLLIVVFFFGGIVGLLLQPYIPYSLIWVLVGIGLVVVAAIVFWEVRQR